MSKQVPTFYPRLPDAWRGTKMVFFRYPKLPPFTREVVEYASTRAEAAVLQDQGFKMTPILFKEKE